MFTSIEAKNFKAFGPAGVRLNLAPLTILLGPNGSGKSSVLDAVALFSQTAETQPTGPPLTWAGSWIDFGGDGRYAIHKLDSAAPMTLSIGIANGRAMAEWRRERDWPEVPQPELKDLEYVFEYNRRSDESLHRLIVNGSVLVERRRTLVPSGFAKQYREILRYPNQERIAGLEFQPITAPVAAFTFHVFEGSTTGPVQPELSSLASTIAQIVSLFVDYVRHQLSTRVFIVGPDRAPRKAALKRPESNMRVGRKGEFTLAILSIVFARAEYGAQAEKIREWARVFGLEKLGGGWTGEKHLQASYYDPKCQTPLPTEYAGFGTQQLLPVIVQVFCAPRGSFIMIEEPEISLHPEAQVDAIRMFADAVRAGQQILITTHSENMLLGLAEAAKECGLKREDVAVYHFSREGKEATAERLELNGNFYIKGWVPSFSQVESRLLKEWSTNVRDKIEPES
jgi:hypothetical protein